MDLAYRLLLITEKWPEGFIELAWLSFKVICLLFPIFFDSFSSVVSSFISLHSLELPVFLCSALSILLGKFPYHFDCPFPLRCHVWHIDFTKSHSISRHVLLYYVVEKGLPKKDTSHQEHISKVSITFQGAQDKSSLSFSTSSVVVLLNVTTLISFMLRHPLLHNPIH